MTYPNKIFHWIQGEEVPSATGNFFDKLNPANGQLLAKVARGDETDAEKALASCSVAFEKWGRIKVIERADILRKAALLLKEKKEEISAIVALESGKPERIAQGEIDAAFRCGMFFADEGLRFQDETLTSGIPNRRLYLIRQPIGVGALLTPFNNPAAGIAWKIFPALLCGNCVVIKSHSDTPYVALWFAKLFRESGLPVGVLNVVQGHGPEVGVPLIEDKRVKFVSLTGSVATGQFILKNTADRLAKVLVEAGGKNPFVVCDDADLEKAVSNAVAGAFVDSGQRCAATSRIIVYEAVYEQFKKSFLEKAAGLKVGIGEECDYGAIISEERLNQILEAVQEAVGRGAVLLAGGKRIMDKERKRGYFMEPTVLENVASGDKISHKELFGPVVALYRVRNFEDALALANDSELKLTGAIHTKNMDLAQNFIDRYQAGVVRVNGPTHGSEPHVPFGGVGLSGNGWREPGRQALDFYSDLKQVSID